MNWTRESLLQFLDDHGIDYQEATHAAVYTMAESATLDLALSGCRCKNLLVQSRKGAERFLLVTPADAAVDLGALGRALGLGRLSLCPPSEMMDLLGVAPGGMSPFALVADMGVTKVRLLMDSALQPASHFLFHPLVNTATLSICSEGLSRFLAAINHPPEFVAAPRRTLEVSSPQ